MHEIGCFLGSLCLRVKAAYTVVIRANRELSSNSGEQEFRTGTATRRTVREEVDGDDDDEIVDTQCTECSPTEYI